MESAEYSKAKWFLRDLIETSLMADPVTCNSLSLVDTVNTKLHAGQIVIVVRDSENSYIVLGLDG